MPASGSMDAICVVHGRSTPALFRDHGRGAWGGSVLTPMHGKTVSAGWVGPRICASRAHQVDPRDGAGDVQIAGAGMAPTIAGR